ncbi:MAG: mechanosensitive ion channel family protein [Clostridiales bacterium]|nr:mechanosensitive ion channel family protein [Clostridiales bacterium]
MDEIVNWLLSPKPYLCIVIVIVVLVIWIATRRFVRKIIGKSEKKDAFAAVVLNIIKYSLAILCVLLVLQINGINVTSAIAGLGIASVIVGLALQDALKDIIMGVNILSENFFRIGDVVKIGDHVGKVSNMTLKSTRIVNGEEGYEVRICNRNIDKVFIYSDILCLDIPLSYEEDTEKIDTVFNEIVSEISSWKEVRKAEFLGLQDYQDSSKLFRLRINCAPQNRAGVRRRALKTIDSALSRNDISIPFPQIDVHTDH